MKISDSQFQALLRETPPLTGDYGIQTHSISNRVKNFLKQWPWLFNFLKETIGPDNSPGNRYKLKKRISMLFGNTGDKKVVLNLGSGTNRVHSEIINVDIFAFKNVDIVADIRDMPFKDATVDGIICGSVLEHIPDTPSVLKEMARILKPGGTLFLTVPFLYPYHSSPDDYFRWTEDGLCYVMKENGLSVAELGVRGGPMCALQGILMHIFALLFSFGSKTLYFLFVQFFMALFSPLKILDLFFMRFPYSIEIASDVFVIAKKN